MSSLPPSKRTLCRMPACPRLIRVRCCATSKPAPSSLTASCRPPCSRRRKTSAWFAPAWRSILRNPSCAMRKRQSAASRGSPSALSATSIFSQHGQALCHVIVQLTRKTRALFLLRVDQSAAQFMCCGFRVTALLMLVKQPRDQSALQQKHGTDYQNLYAKLFPCGRTTKENLASRGQAALANPQRCISSSHTSAFQIRSAVL